MFEDGQGTINEAEKFESYEQYLKAAKKMSGSRDFGAQMFTALLRAYHFNVRLVCSVQSLGYKFNEREQYDKKDEKEPTAPEVIDLDSELSAPDSDIEALLGADEVSSGLDDDLEYPMFWTELFDSHANRWIALDAMVRSLRPCG
ncbi:hypothetical protein MRB53_040842 [Persea americana]|nr:hypothetical protein MRB53_040842 [Persea americana]